MFEQRHILDKIEQWAERLPYRSLRIEIELPGQRLTLEKQKALPIGFKVPEQKEVKIANGKSKPTK